MSTDKPEEESHNSDSVSVMERTVSALSRMEPEGQSESNLNQETTEATELMEEDRIPGTS